jgi:hypothetical protein
VPFIVPTPVMNATALEAVHVQPALVAIDSVNSPPAAAIAFAGASPTAKLQFGAGVGVGLGLGVAGDSLLQPADDVISSRQSAVADDRTRKSIVYRHGSATM